MPTAGSVCNASFHMKVRTVFTLKDVTTLKLFSLLSRFKKLLLHFTL